MQNAVLREMGSPHAPQITAPTVRYAAAKSASDAVQANRSAQLQRQHKTFLLRLRDENEKMSQAKKTGQTLTALTAATLPVQAASSYKNIQAAAKTQNQIAELLRLEEEKRNQILLSQIAAAQAQNQFFNPTPQPQEGTR